jgi:hypothetical protein
MINLTPLQEIASRIYAANIIAYLAHDTLRATSIGFRLDNSVIQAKLLLEATKPEPLDWVYEVEYHSKGGEFVIVEGGHPSGEDEPAYFIKYSSNNLPDNENAISWFCDLDEAKAFAEFIRSR